MDKFQIIVLSIAVFILIIILTAIGLGLRNLKNKIVYPPIANQCPDYWPVASDNVSCSIPLYPNGKNIGTSYNSDGSIKFTNSTVPGFNSSTINFNDPGWSANGSSTCNKQKWANQYQVVWDGISNYNSC